MPNHIQDRMTDKKRSKIVILCSGSGTNAQRIIEYFENNNTVEVIGIFCSNTKAGVIDRMKKYQIPLMTFNKTAFNGNWFSGMLEVLNPDLIVLAGFLWKIPKHIIETFPRKIINIHPSLLPKYGGKGMYGMNVHTQVISDKETQSGITIHWVDENYDQGDIIFQQKVPVYSDDTPEMLACRIHEQEYIHFPRVIASVLQTEN